MLFQDSIRNPDQAFRAPETLSHDKKTEICVLLAMGDKESLKTRVQVSRKERCRSLVCKDTSCLFHNSWVQSQGQSNWKLLYGNDKGEPFKYHASLFCFWRTFCSRTQLLIVLSLEGSSFINLNRQTESHHLSWHKIKEEMEKVQKRKQYYLK